NVDLLLGPRDQDDAIRLEALALALFQDSLGRSMLIDQKAAESKARHAALPEAQLDEMLLTDEDLLGELEAVHPSEDPHDPLLHVRAEAAIVLELLTTIEDVDPGVPAQVFVVAAPVDVLKPAPSAHVVDEDDREIDLAPLHIIDQLLERA